ncbi:MAG: segregation and condensation protein A [Patescibacteria group bacterium]
MQSQTSTNFSVDTKSFTGPFEALLILVEKKKLHISEVSLGQIADEYIAYVRENEFRLSDATGFIYIAATLMLIKSRHLLPQFIITDEEEKDISMLERSLKLYAVFKEQAYILAKEFASAPIYQARKRRIEDIHFQPDIRITPRAMRESMYAVFATVEQDVFKPQKEVAPQKSLKEIIEDISARIKHFVELRFSELVQGRDRRECAVSFLAVLELFKQGEISLEQEEQFAPITINRESNKGDG